MRLPRKDLGIEKDEPTRALQMEVPKADSTLRLKREEMSLEEPTVALQAGVPKADATLRLKREEMSLEEPTVALQAGVPKADATLRLKREEMSLEEPTVALQAGVPKAGSTLRLKREELSLEEPTQALERPRLRTAMEVIDEATQVETPQIKPSVMMPDASDIPSWEESTQFFTPPPGGHAATTVQVLRSLEPAPLPVDPGDSMDETFSHGAVPAHPAVAIGSQAEPAGLMLVSEISETEEETLVLPDMHELDELPNAMRATMVMPILEAPAAQQKPESMETTAIVQVELAPPPMEKTMVMSILEAPAAQQKPESMEATAIVQVEPAPAPTEKTMVMSILEAPRPSQLPEPMEATILMQVESPPMPMEETVVLSALEATVGPPTPEPMEATTVMHVPAEEPSAYLTRQGQSPWPLSPESAEPSPVSTQLMSESLLSKAMEATNSNSDSGLAPIPPEVSAIEEDSPLARAGEFPVLPNPTRPASPSQERTTDTSIGMVVTPPTLLMPVQRPLDPTVPIQRPTTPPAPPAPLAAASEPYQVSGMPAKPAPRSSQPMHAPPESKPKQTRPVEHAVSGALPSVPGYPDRRVPTSVPEPKFQTKPMDRPASPVRLASPAYVPIASQDLPAGSLSKIWISGAIGALLLVIGGVYFTFFRPPLNTKSPLITLPNQTAEPILPVPTDMQGTLAQAKAGDSKAMHMLGVSFYYGLNVPQNRAEGLRWMRKAAAAGNEKAKSDLRQMETGNR